MALLTFGGIVDLVSGTFERNLMSLKLENSIAKFCGQFNIDKRENTTPEICEENCKAQ